GNVGNLLQHWVFCEILAACRKHAEHVTFVDAYSMAPLANERPTMDGTAHLFDFVRGRLPGVRTPYEQAWLKLASPRSAYPNSASFLTAVWRGRYSLLLCESESATVQELRRWVEDRVERSPKCVHANVADGDWRNRFRDGLPAWGDLTFLSFDPYMFDRNGPGRNPKPGNMYPSDLELLAAAVEPIQSPVIVQLSTYSANNDNPQSAVVKVVHSRLEHSGLQEVAKVRADGNMMSLVLARNIDGVESIRSLSARFESWLGQVRDKLSGRPSGVAQ
ncbi:MAG: hypothetical protein Q8R28_24055, partial [Dehalococcoidia bacterium]|nr:hypothetical protein [Dehalococcoidia bacterium]